MSQDERAEALIEADAAKERLRNGIERSKAVLKKYRKKLFALRQPQGGEPLFRFDDRPDRRT